MAVRKQASYWKYNVLNQQPKVAKICDFLHQQLTFAQHISWTVFYKCSLPLKDSLVIINVKLIILLHSSDGFLNLAQDLSTLVINLGFLTEIVNCFHCYRNEFENILNVFAKRLVIKTSDSSGLEELFLVDKRYFWSSRDWQTYRIVLNNCDKLAGMSNFTDKRNIKQPFTS